MEALLPYAAGEVLDDVHRCGTMHGEPAYGEAGGSLARLGSIPAGIQGGLTTHDARRQRMLLLQVVLWVAAQAGPPALITMLAGNGSR